MLFSQINAYKAYCVEFAVVYILLVYMRHYNYKKLFNESNRLYKQFRKDSFLL